MDLHHAGNWRLVGRIAVAGDNPSDLFECPLCFALVLDPNDHAEWHEWSRTRHPYGGGSR